MLVVMTWVFSLVADNSEVTAELLAPRVLELVELGLVESAGDVLGLVAGTKLTSGATNFMRLHTVGESDRARRTRQKKK